MAMVALLSSFSHSLHTNPSFHQLKKPSSRTNILITCRSQLPTGKERISEHKEEEEEEKEKKKKKLWGGVMEELGRGMKLESLMIPKHKGDWKDLVLMSLSFAVYVYISQRLVCTYCAWISLLKQHSSF